MLVYVLRLITGTQIKVMKIQVIVSLKNKYQL